MDIKGVAQGNGTSAVAHAYVCLFAWKLLLVVARFFSFFPFFTRGGTWERFNSPGSHTHLSPLYMSDLLSISPLFPRR